MHSDARCIYYYSTLRTAAAAAFALAISDVSYGLLMYYESLVLCLYHYVGVERDL